MFTLLESRGLVFTWPNFPNTDCLKTRNKLWFLTYVVKKYIRTRHEILPYRPEVVHRDSFVSRLLRRRLRNPTSGAAHLLQENASGLLSIQNLYATGVGQESL